MSDQSDVQIIVSKLFGPNGDNLVGLSDVTFDGFPAITLSVETPDGRCGDVHLSPIHGDARKQGYTNIPVGTRCRLSCPVSKQPLRKVEEIDDSFGAGYYALYRTADLSEASVVMVSDVWGHYHSRVVDNFELISAWGELHKDLAGK